jgi:hypothetical protein
MTIILKPRIIEYLIAKAKRSTLTDSMEEYEEVDASSYFGGNMDDAYWGGFEDGENNLAREILNEYGIKYD